jgi:hypothetical protein
MAKDSKKSKKSSKDDRSLSSRSTRREKSPKQGKSSKEKSKRGKSPKRDKDAKSTRKEVKGDRAALLLSSKNPENVLEYIPEDYLVNPETAEPVLHFLPKMIASSEPTGTSTVGSSVQSNTKFPNLRVLLAAAEDDIRLHRARVQAAKFTDITYLRSYKIESDEQWLVRQQRLNERKLMLNKLNTERSIIMKELQASNVKGLTAHEMKQVQLARWQRALELFVYAPPVEGKETDADDEEEDLEFLGLLEKLLEGITEVRYVSVGHESDMLCSAVPKHYFNTFTYYETYRKKTCLSFCRRPQTCAVPWWMLQSKLSRMRRNKCRMPKMCTRFGSRRTICLAAML